jgi:CheY-like chemotaxis protein
LARILIVDDEESDILLLRSILEAANHDVYFARDGYTALREYQGNGIQVVVTDLQMPELQLIAVLREFSPRPAIVAVSNTGQAQLEMAVAMGAEATVNKPIRADDILAAVDRALRPDTKP